MTMIAISLGKFCEDDIKCNLKVYVYVVGLSPSFL